MFFFVLLSWSFVTSISGSYPPSCPTFAIFPFHCRETHGEEHIKTENLRSSRICINFYFHLVIPHPLSSIFGFCLPFDLVYLGLLKIYFSLFRPCHKLKWRGIPLLDFCVGLENKCPIKIHRIRFVDTLVKSISLLLFSFTQLHRSLVPRVTPSSMCICILSHQFSFRHS